jgi:hypothetical protein
VFIATVNEIDGGLTVRYVVEFVRLGRLFEGFGQQPRVSWVVLDEQHTEGSLHCTTILQYFHCAGTISK